MEDRKKIARMANRIREGLVQLKLGRYMELSKRLTNIIGQLQRLTVESRKMEASVTRGWLSAAQKCYNRANHPGGHLSGFVQDSSGAK